MLKLLRLVENFRFFVSIRPERLRHLTSYSSVTMPFMTRKKVVVLSFNRFDHGFGGIYRDQFPSILNARFQSPNLL